MTNEACNEVTQQIKQFAKRWNEMYAAEEFEAMKDLATEDVGIANAQASSSLSD